MKSMFTRLTAYRKRVVIMVGIIGAVGLFASLPANVLAGTPDLRGRWVTDLNLEFIITSSGSSMTGKGRWGSGGHDDYMILTGSVSGDSVSITGTTYEAQYKGLVMVFNGKLTNGKYGYGNTMSGTWRNNLNNNSGTWSATRKISEPPQTPIAPDKSQPVAKITQIKEISRNAPSKIEYARGDKWYTAYDGMDIMIGDKLRTDGNTVAAIEFVLGGRVGINKSSVIEIVGEGTVKEIGKPSVKRIIIRQGGMWAKLAKRNDPLEIQTNGGIMGIRDTAGRSTGK